MASSLTDWLSTGAQALNTAAGGNIASTSNTGVNPYGVLAGLYDTIEVRSNAAPPIKISVADLGGGPSPVSQALQPTIIFTGAAGRYAIAPYGEAGEYTGWFSSVGGAFALVGLGFLLGKLRRR